MNAGSMLTPSWGMRNHTHFRRQRGASSGKQVRDFCSFLFQPHSLSECAQVGASRSPKSALLPLSSQPPWASCPQYLDQRLAPPRPGRPVPTSQAHIWAGAFGLLAQPSRSTDAGGSEVTGPARAGCDAAAARRRGAPPQRSRRVARFLFG